MSSLQHQDSISLAQLMPLSTSPMGRTPIKGVVNNYKHLVKFSQEAIHSFLAGVLPDPLVGENACHIRALYYCQMAQDQELCSELQKISGLFKNNLNTIEKISLPTNKKTFHLLEVLKENKLDIQIPEKVQAAVCQIVFGYILTVTKKSNYTLTNLKGEESDYKLLPEVTSHCAHSLISKGRKALSDYSIKCLRSEASLLPSHALPEINNAFSKQILMDTLGLQSFPCFPGIQIVLASLKAHRIPIVLKNQIVLNDKVTGAVTLFFDATGKEGSFELISNLDGIDKTRPGFIMEAVASSDKPCDQAQLISTLKDIGMETILLANLATHPDYGGISTKVELPETEERKLWKDRALKLGLCAANPELCRLYHIYAARLSTQLQQNRSDEKKNQ